MSCHVFFSSLEKAEKADQVVKIKVLISNSRGMRRPLEASKYLGYFGVPLTWSLISEDFQRKFHVILLVFRLCQGG